MYNRSFMTDNGVRINVRSSDPNVKVTANNVVGFSTLGDWFQWLFTLTLLWSASEMIQLLFTKLQHMFGF